MLLIRRGVNEMTYKKIDLLKVGVVADAATDNTLKLNEYLSNDEPKEVILREGIALSGPIKIGSNTILRLEKGAVLKFIPDENIYPPVYSRWEGVMCYCMQPCLFINEAHDVKIKGPGIIDGTGQVWWDKTRDKKKDDAKPTTTIEKKLASLNVGYENQQGGGGGRQSQFLKPPLVQFLKCTDVEISNVTLQNSPFWTLHPLFTQGLIIKNVVIKNPYDAPNTDGIDIDSCSNVRISGCSIDVGDDGIALKSGSGEDGRKIGFETKKVSISNCVVYQAHGGVVIGSETAAGISDVFVRSCAFIGTDRGIRIKTRRERGGVIKNLHYSNIVMTDNLCPITINMYYRCGTDDMSLFDTNKKEINELTPVISGIYVKDVVATKCKASLGFMVGLPESPIKRLFLKNVTLSMDKDSTISADESEMFMGLEPASDRGMRQENVKARIANVILEP